MGGDAHTISQWMCITLYYIPAILHRHNGRLGSPSLSSEIKTWVYKPYEPMNHSAQLRELAFNQHQNLIVCVENHRRGNRQDLQTDIMIGLPLLIF